MWISLYSYEAEPIMVRKRNIYEIALNRKNNFFSLKAFTKPSETHTMALAVQTPAHIFRIAF